MAEYLSRKEKRQLDQINWRIPFEVPEYRTPAERARDESEMWRYSYLLEDFGQELNWLARDRTIDWQRKNLRHTSTAKYDAAVRAKLKK